MTYPSIHRVNPEKEKKSAYKLALGVTVVSLIVCVAAYSGRTVTDDFDFIPYLIGMVLFDAFVIGIMLPHTIGLIKHYKLELIDDDHFNVTTNKGTEKYYPGRITTIEFYKTSIRSVNLKTGKYPANIPDSLENYPVVMEYFTNMAKRLGNGVWPK